MAITDRLRETPSLRLPNWDGYRAAPVTDEALSAADELYSRFVAVPTVNGGVQIEVHSNGWDIEIEIDANGRPNGALIEPEWPEGDI